MSEIKNKETKITYSISGIVNDYTLIIKASNQIIIKSKVNLLLNEIRELKDIIIKYLENRGFD